jgi:hypothetical protein
MDGTPAKDVGADAALGTGGVPGGGRVGRGFRAWDRLRLAGVLVVWLGRALTVPGAGFGFTGPELYPIDQGIGLLRVADVDGDGLQDLVLANNTRARIVVMYNRTGQPAWTNRPAVDRVREPNALPPDARFEIRSIASEKRISALEVSDLNGDGRPDLVYFGEPRELVVQYNEGGRRWSVPETWSLSDVPFSPNVLAVADLDGDGRTDVLVVGESQIHWFRQTGAGRLTRADPIPLGQPAYSLQVLDVDGDQRQDLLLVNWESPDPLRVRFQRADGGLGPELYFRFPALRAYWADRAGADGPACLVAIGQASGRALLARFESVPPERKGPFAQGQFEVFPLPRTDKVRRGVAWADVDGDGSVDLVASDPDQGHLLVGWADGQGEVAMLRRLPSLLGVTEIVVADWDGDGRPEVFLLSPDEKAVGMTRIRDRDTVPFPTFLPIRGRPLGMALDRPGPDQPPVLAVVVEEEGRRSVTLLRAQGEPVRIPLSESFKGQLTGMVWHDADGDGLGDLILLASYERIKVLRQRGRGEFEELDVPPPGGVLENPWLAPTDLDGDGRPELLLAQRNLVRSVRLQQAPAGSGSDSSWSFQVLEQINAASRDSRLVAATALMAGESVPALFLLDATTRALQLLVRQTNGVWEVVDTLGLPRADYFRLQVLSGPGAGPVRLGLIGLATAAQLRLGGPVWALRELDQYETPVRDGYLRDVVAGDLDQDGHKEWVLLETARHYVDIVRWEGDRLVPGDRWPVFEERSYQRAGAQRMEPREACVADVTGDGRNDLILVVHDRVLVYPQEPPAAQSAGESGSVSSTGRRHSGYTDSGN